MHYDGLLKKILLRLLTDCVCAEVSLLEFSSFIINPGGKIIGWLSHLTDWDGPQGFMNVWGKHSVH